MSGDPESATSDDALVVLVTAPVDQAGPLADRLLELRLIACANLVGPIESRYHWDGAVQSDQEMLLILKTAADRFEALRRAVVELHPYEVPEILGIPVAAGHPAYLEWILRCCGPDGTTPGPQVDR